MKNKNGFVKWRFLTVNMISKVYKRKTYLWSCSQSTQWWWLQKMRWLFTIYLIADRDTHARHRVDHPRRVGQTIQSAKVLLIIKYYDVTDDVHCSPDTSSWWREWRTSRVRRPDPPGRWMWGWSRLAVLESNLGARSRHNWSLPDLTTPLSVWGPYWTGGSKSRRSRHWPSASSRPRHTQTWWRRARWSPHWCPRLADPAPPETETDYHQTATQLVS